jgi:GNAT superfamily N-acetyltransferase
MPVEPRPWRTRIRAVFVHPEWTRRGIGRRLVTQAETAAARAGFTTFELDATLPGLPLCKSLGYREVARSGHRTPDGTILPRGRERSGSPVPLEVRPLGPAFRPRQPARRLGARPSGPETIA